MANFDRKLKRDKKEYQFTTKPIEKKKKSSEFRENFNLKWIPLNWKSILFIIIDYMAVSFIFIPMLVQKYNMLTALTLGHGVLTSLLLVLTFYFINEEKPPLSALFIRYCFLALVLGLASFVTGKFIL
ncbi:MULTISPECIES: hypothetical protein [Coprobacillaceae]|uniref:hypothetical protein n=1 Tax=Coprobacillaceae TaxID=2810280 RepID=UPI000E4B29C8|nr:MULTISPECIES: hypothetical protein [Coprobacillaceae]RHM62354.1 hypothetical protein DWZ53_03145 [Coprobacillus sp. AF33-1AC]RHS95706.1 hypothetical protein DW911_02955 [Erysipelatoclostridium sp. AM42-17]